MDTGRSFLEGVKVFPENIETEVTATYVSNRDDGLESVTVVLHHSMVALPKEVMRPRLADSRVGYFQSGYVEYGRNDQKAVQRRFIHRWRLEKKDPQAALSDPVKPITYYIGREVPDQWRPWIKKGVESWREAFEQAAFTNAIVCKNAPSEAEDPDWDAEDTRYSVIRWLPTTTENAYGPSIIDPRSGEILNADTKLHHNVLKLLRDWYFVQASPNDPRAQRLPFPDDLMGRLVEYVVAHEVGHTLGLAHNMKGSSSYTVAQLRDPVFTERFGTEASIMDYGRFNYVAQPGDGASLIPIIGPYDRFAIEWGYKPIPAPNADGETRALDTLAARQISDPTLRFGSGPERGTDEDPTEQTEDLSDDALAATTLGLANLDRVLTWLVPAVSKPGEDYDDLRDMFNKFMGQRNQELIHVARLVGGVVETDYHYGYGQGKAVYEAVPAARQRAAALFLLEHAFTVPTELLRPDLLDRIESKGIGDRVLGIQNSLLNLLLDEGRAARMTDQEALHPGRSYSLATLMDDLRQGIWSDLAAPRVVIHPFRRNVQRSYLRALAAKIAPASASSSDLRPLSRGALEALRGTLEAAMPRAGDAATRLHLVDSIATVERALTVKP